MARIPQPWRRAAGRNLLFKMVLVKIGKIQRDHDDVDLPAVDDLGETGHMVVARHADEADQALFLHLLDKIHRAAGREDQSRRPVADAVNVEQIDVAGFHAAQRLLKLPLHFARGLARIGVAGNGLGRQKNFIAPARHQFAQIILRIIVDVRGVDIADALFQGGAVHGHSLGNAGLALADGRGAKAEDVIFSLVRPSTRKGMPAAFLPASGFNPASAPGPERRPRPPARPRRAKKPGDPNLSQIDPVS